MRQHLWALSFLYRGGGTGQTNHFCWLFHFDPSTTTCEIFDAVDTSTLPDTVSGLTNLCGGDCSGDEEHQIRTTVPQVDDAFNETRRRSKRSGATRFLGFPGGHDVCYDPTSVNVGVAAIRTPNGCERARAGGSLPVVDVNRMSVQYSGLYLTDETVYFNECWTNAYANDGAQRCRLFPHSTNWAGGRQDFTTFNRCPPTRAGLATRSLSTEQMVGKRFAPLAPTLLRLDGHPDILSATECEIACVQTSTCCAWDYSERGSSICTRCTGISNPPRPSKTTAHAFWWTARSSPATPPARSTTAETVTSTRTPRNPVCRAVGHKTSSRDQRVLPFKCRQRVRDAVSVYPQRTVLLDVGLLGGVRTSAPTRCSIHTAKGLVGQAARPLRRGRTHDLPRFFMPAMQSIVVNANSARGTTRTPATR